ncbi:hypothetical protein ANO11243_053550 [Dothideomycetidae sp. 11243]|nr:hypothetical protein ANO11243_053550 [fungal sp. No.11243]
MAMITMLCLISETTSIPTNPRTTRPVGYAFVDVSTPSEAERAIADLNGKTILDRKVSVQLARKPEPAAAAAAPAATEAEGAEGTRRRSSTRGRGRGRGRGGRGGRAARSDKEETKEGAPTNLPAQVLPLTETTNEAASATPGEADTTDDKTGKSKVPRPRKQRGPPEDGIASKTKIMVANLPYEMREDKLMELFAQYQPSSAKIALRPIPKFMIKKLEARNEPRKGRGFGFVTLASEELQQKACQEMNGKEIEGREIAVKVAIDSPGKEDEDPNAPVEDGAAETSAKASTTEASTTATA